MKLREVVDEFEKQQYDDKEIIPRLYRFQAFCARDAHKYFQYLHDKYPGLNLTNSDVQDFQTRSADGMVSPNEFMKALSTMKILTPTELYTLRRKFTRMVDAKEKFEQASGDSTYEFSRRNGYTLRLGESDDFEKQRYKNKDDLLENLFRFQSVCTINFIKFFYFVKEKYSWTAGGIDEDREMQMRSFDTFSSPRQYFSGINDLSKHDLETLKRKYKKMLDAKKAYERAGGKLARYDDNGRLHFY